MVRWHHRLKGHGIEQTLGDREGQGSLVCCSPWGRRVGHNLATKQQQQHGVGIGANCFFFFNHRLQSTKIVILTLDNKDILEIVTLFLL